MESVPVLKIKLQLHANIARLLVVKKTAMLLHVEWPTGEQAFVASIQRSCSDLALAGRTTEIQLLGLSLLGLLN